MYNYNLRVMGKILVILLFVVGLNAYSQTSYAQIEELVKQSKYFEASKLVPEFSAENKKDFKSQLLCGDVFYNLEEYEKALEYYKKAESIDNSKYQTLYRVGRTLHRLGKQGEAFKYLDDAIDEIDDKKAIEPYLEYADAKLRDKNIMEAETWINRAKDKNDKDSRVYLAFGDMYFSQGIYQLAIDNYLIALKYDEKNIQARSNLAESYYWQANREVESDLSNQYFKKALIEYDKVAELDPFNAKAFYQTGKVLFWASRFEDAAPKLNRAVQLNPENKLARWMLAQSLTDLNRCDSAAQHLEWVSQNIDSVKVKAQLLLARCYFTNQEYAKSMEQFEKIKKDTSLSTIDLKRFGNAAILNEDTTKAVSIFEEAIATDPENTCDLMMLLGQLYYVKKDYDNAIGKFGKRLTTEACTEGKEKVAYFLGLSYLFSANSKVLDNANAVAKDSTSKEKIIRLNKAKEYFTQAISLDSNDLKSMVYMGDVFADLGDKEKAGKQYELVIEKATKNLTEYAPQLRQALAKLCGMYYEMKKYDEVVKYGTIWAEAQADVEYGPLYVAIAYQNMYVASQSDADKAKACEWYNKVLKVNPNNSTAKKNLGLIGC